MLCSVTCSSQAVQQMLGNFALHLFTFLLVTSIY